LGDRSVLPGYKIFAYLHVEKEMSSDMKTHYPIVVRKFEDDFDSVVGDLDLLQKFQFEHIQVVLFDELKRLFRVFWDEVFIDVSGDCLDFHSTETG